MDETRQQLQPFPSTPDRATRAGQAVGASSCPSRSSVGTQLPVAATGDRRIEEEIAQLVFALSGRFKARVGALLAQFDLTVPQAWLLLSLDGPLSMGEVAARLCADPSTVTWIADRLEARSLLERRPHPTDRRVKQLVLTPQGTIVRERLHAVLADVPGLSALSATELQALRDLLRRAVGGCS
jgi:DNA-binding MarR family transcriptional regulator